MFPFFSPQLYIAIRAAKVDINNASKKSIKCADEVPVHIGNAVNKVPIILVKLIIPKICDS